MIIGVYGSKLASWLDEEVSEIFQILLVDNALDYQIPQSLRPTELLRKSFDLN